MEQSLHLSGKLIVMRQQARVSARVGPFMKEIEFHNLSLKTILSSEIYQYMKDNNYHLVNLLHSDLFFVHEDVRSQI